MGRIDIVLINVTWSLIGQSVGFRTLLWRISVYPVYSYIYSPAALFLRSNFKGNKGMSHRFCKVNAQSGGFFPGADVFVDSFRLYIKI